MLTNGPNIYQAARKESCLTQEQAAERLDVSETTVKAWEQGTRVPDNETVARMAELYGTPWLALEHLNATDTLGVLPEVKQRPLPMASIALRNRLYDAMGRLDTLLRIAEDDYIDETERPEFDVIVDDLRETIAAIYQVIYSREAVEIKKERPVAATTRRSVQGFASENDSKIIISHFARNASPTLSREGGVSR